MILFSYVKSLHTRILCRTAKFFLDSEKLVILGYAFASAGGACLDLAGIKRNGKVGNSGVFGFTGTVGRNSGVARLVRHLDRL